MENKSGHNAVFLGTSMSEEVYFADIRYHLWILLWEAEIRVKKGLCEITLNLGKKAVSFARGTSRRSGHNKRLVHLILLRRTLYSGAQRVPWPNDGAQLKLESDTGNVLLIWQAPM